MALITAFDKTFREEIAMNDPTTSLAYVAEYYRKYKLYKWDDTIEFYNTKMISKAASEFKKYARYNDLDPVRDAREWKEWWDREEYRRVNGITLPIATHKGGGNSDKDLINIWIPGTMYGHLNYGPINRTKDPDEKNLTVRDAINNDVQIAVDTKNKLKLDNLLQGLQQNEVADSIYDFPDFWDGHYHYWIADNFASRIGMDMIVFKARRKGFSYVGGWDAFNTYDLVPGSNTVLIAYDEKYLTKKDKLFYMVKQYSDFINKHTDWAKERLTDTTKELISGYKLKDGTKEGFFSSVLALTCKDNPDVARGIKAKKFKWEESGSNPLLAATYEATSSAAETGGYVVGQHTFWATIGSDESDYQDFASFFYKPLSANCLPFDNLFDTGKKGTACGFFYSHLMNYEGGGMDVHGNSLYEEANVIHDKKRQQKKNNSKAQDFDKWDAERVTEPAKALFRKSNNIFAPYAKVLNDTLDRMERDPLFKDLGKCGRYDKIMGKVKFISNEELESLGIETHPELYDVNSLLPDNYDMHGCIVEYAPPFVMQRNYGNKVEFETPSGIYGIWHDPYATDKDGEGGEVTMRDSVGAAIVYERINNITHSKGCRVVATWIGRPSTTEEYNRQLLYLCERYNCIEGLAFENDRGDVIKDFKHWKATRFLMPEPDLFSLKELAGKTGRNFGMSIAKNAGRKAEGARLFRDMLGWQVSAASEFDEPHIFAEYLMSKRFIRELLMWSINGNFDCVSAAIIGAYAEREAIDKNFAGNAEANTNVDADDFWSRDFF